MPTTPKPSTKDEDANASDSSQDQPQINDNKPVFTPDRKPLGKSASLPASDGESSIPWKTPTEGVEILDESTDMPRKTPTGDIASNDVPWKTPTGDIASNDMPWKTPTEYVEINNSMAFQPDDCDDEILFYPATHASAVAATPIVSNKRRNSDRMRSNVRRRSDGNVGFERNVEKSVSFNKNIQSQEIVFEESDDAYGQFCTSSCEESPNFQPLAQHSSMALDETRLSGNITDEFEDGKEMLKGQPDDQEDIDRLSLPELKISSKRISFTNKSSHRRFNSNISEISLDSEVDFVAESNPVGNDNSMVQMNSNRRLSLTVDMETGRSPNRSTKKFYRGQQAIRRVHSGEFMNAQSPRTRRRKTISYNVEQFRQNLSRKLSLPSPRSLNDLQKLAKDQDKVDVESQQGSKEDDDLSEHSRESIRIADRKRRRRYTVEQVQDLRNDNVSSDVQYRLSAISPIELRRRRYRNSLTGGTDTDENVRDANAKSQNAKNGDEATAGCTSAKSRCDRFIGCVGNLIIEVVIFVLSKGKENYSVGVINKVLYWSFRKNLLIVLLSAACSFYVMTVIFAMFIYFIGLRNPQCIHVNGVDFDETKNRFIDAFALSWTTFTTVGYGLVYPGTSATMDDPTFWTCTQMNIITTLEAFFGILFSGFWGAIWFAKVTRVSAFAQVSFSDFIVIKYGTGVTGVDENEEYEEGSSEEDVIMSPSQRSMYKQSKLPCPILEFRIANRLHRQKGGEIIDACLNIVASMEECQATRTVQNGSGMEPRIRRKGRRPKRSSTKKIKSPSGRSLLVTEDEEDVKRVNIQELQQAARSMVARYVDSENSVRRFSRSRSSTSSKAFPNQIFAKLQVESLEHPFFKRVWNVRHVLDVSSPLLKPEAKDLMRANGGHWPEELNNPTAVRASIQFDQILVSFSGTSNVDANSVYSQNAYKFEDVYVGYAFCNMLFREANGSIGVDHTLLNDVKEQSGGGGEELHQHDPDSSSTRSIPDIFIL